MQKNHMMLRLVLGSGVSLASFFTHAATYQPVSLHIDHLSRPDFLLAFPAANFSDGVAPTGFILSDIANISATTTTVPTQNGGSFGGELRIVADYNSPSVNLAAGTINLSSLHVRWQEALLEAEPEPTDEFRIVCGDPRFGPVRTCGLFSPVTGETLFVDRITPSDTSPTGFVFRGRLGAAPPGAPATVPSPTADDLTLGRPYSIDGPVSDCDLAGACFRGAGNVGFYLDGVLQNTFECFVPLCGIAPTEADARYVFGRPLGTFSPPEDIYLQGPDAVPLTLNSDGTYSATWLGDTYGDPATFTFVFAPVPEPRSYALFAAGMGLIMLRRKWLRGSVKR